MKYLGQIQDDKDLVTKEYVDGFVSKTEIEQCTTIEIDSVPTSNSNNLITSGGVKSALDAKSDFSGDYNDLTNKPTIPDSYSLPTASASELGGVKIGTGLSINANGVLSATEIEEYTDLEIQTIWDSVFTN